MAFVHHQFEAIHPFMDGDGRVGRMLASLMAVADGLLDMPVLYLSPVIERHKDIYIDPMLAVSTRGEWQAWLRFFLDCVTESCVETIATIDRLLTLQDAYRGQAGMAMRTASGVTLVDHLFQQPAITVNDAAGVLGVTYAAVCITYQSLDRTGDVGAFRGLLSGRLHRTRHSRRSLPAGLTALRTAATSLSR